jgi:hypothetical protein
MGGLRDTVFFCARLYVKRDLDNALWAAIEQQSRLDGLSGYPGDVAQ